MRVRPQRLLSSDETPGDLSMYAWDTVCVYHSHVRGTFKETVSVGLMDQPGFVTAGGVEGASHVGHSMSPMWIHEALSRAERYSSCVLINLTLFAFHVR